VQDVAAVITELTGGEGVDRIVEVEFGGNLGVSQQVLKAGGVLAAYGSAAVPTPTLPFYPMMFRHMTLQLVFVYALTAAQRHRVLGLINEALAAGALTHPIAARFALPDTALAHTAVESGTAVGNVIVTINKPGG
jgi:NADPH2:quinone reductase